LTSAHWEAAPTENIDYWESRVRLGESPLKGGHWLVTVELSPVVVWDWSSAPWHI